MIYIHFSYHDLQLSGIGTDQLQEKPHLLIRNSVVSMYVKNPESVYETLDHQQDGVLDARDVVGYVGSIHVYYALGQEYTESFVELYKV